jgi:hypothetical protein
VSAPIFISYSSKDRDMAETICRALEVRGHQCWISCRDVHPGQNFQEGDRAGAAFGAGHAAGVHR